MSLKIKEIYSIDNTNMLASTEKIYNCFIKPTETQLNMKLSDA
jgi:hypothetical protein